MLSWFYFFHNCRLKTEGVIMALWLAMPEKFRTTDLGDGQSPK
jgi:hypothetical protein